MTSLTRRLSSFVSGKPPSVLRSQRVVDWTDAGVVDEEFEVKDGERWWIVTMKVPPVEGWRATSPRERENVERSSWANCEGYVSRC